MKHFNKDYWDTNYYDVESMDCIGNSHGHLNYIKAIFQLENIPIKKIIDLGFGLGYFFRDAIKKFRPSHTTGIEPSPHAYDYFKNKLLTSSLKSHKNYDFYNQDILNWCIENKNNSKSSYDLGLCTSVFQYIPKKDLEIIIPILSRKIRFLYLTVPTTKEFKRQRVDENFEDPYAIKRSQSFYYNLISKNFTFISVRLLESKYFYSESNSHFTDFLYRF